MPVTPVPPARRRLTITPVKSCVSCPQYMTEEAQRKDVGKTVGGPVCLLKMRAIGQPGVNNKFPERQAKSCDRNGTPNEGVKPEARTAPLEFPVAMPSMAAMTGEPPVDPDAVRSCRTCKHFFPSPIVTQVSGWSSGFCGAKGTLLLEDRLDRYASICSLRSRADRARSAFASEDLAEARSINFLPEYTDGFGKVDVLAGLRSVVEPTTFVGTKGVSDNAKKLGIRTVREIRDPKGYGDPVYLPVFDLEFFPPEERVKIPRTGDDEHPESYVDHQGLVYKSVVAWTKLNETPALWGPAGVGKTELFRHIAWLMVAPFERISITAQTEIDDIAGKMMYSPEKGTYFQYGRIPLAWTKPNVLCVDEPNLGPPEVWHFIRPLTDNSKQMVLDMNNGEHRRKHPMCYFGTSMNPAWDPRNSSALELADADGSRLFHIYVNLPPANIEREILLHACKRSKGWDENAIHQTVETVMKIAPELRRLSDDGVIPVSWGVRSQIKAARARRWFSWYDAYSHAIADSLEPQARESILTVVRSYCPEEDD